MIDYIDSRTVLRDIFARYGNIHTPKDADEFNQEIVAFKHFDDTIPDKVVDRIVRDHQRILSDPKLARDSFTTEMAADVALASLYEFDTYTSYKKTDSYWNYSVRQDDRWLVCDTSPTISCMDLAFEQEELPENPPSKANR